MPDLPKLNIVRASHFRHINGAPVMKKDCWENLKLNFSSCDAEPISCSKTYVASPTCLPPPQPLDRSSPSVS